MMPTALDSSSSAASTPPVRVMQKSHSVDNGQVSVSEPDVMADPSTPPLGSKEEADLQQLVAPHTTGRLKLPWALRVQSRTQCVAWGMAVVAVACGHASRLVATMQQGLFHNCCGSH
eukprot:364743-Chlamydomonas_euryale.AAC.94